MPYQEVHHTADRCLHVWGPDLNVVFVDAALGLSSIAGFTFEPSVHLERTLSFAASDHEGLLVAFLSELLFIAEMEKVGFTEFSCQFQPGTVQIAMSGAPLLSIERNIKAVTWHDLRIQPLDAGLEVFIILDM